MGQKWQWEVTGWEEAVELEGERVSMSPPMTSNLFVSECQNSQSAHWAEVSAGRSGVGR